MLTLTSVFHKNAEAWLNPKIKYIINQGGTSSSKTFSELQLLTEVGRKHEVQTDVVGLSVPHLKSGVLNDMPRVMDGFSMNFHDMYQSTDKKIVFPKAGTINFLAFDKLGKAHGGRRDNLFLNEANHLPYAIAEQLMIRTRNKVLIDYNPTSEFWVHTQLMKNEPEKCCLIKSTYRDNQFLEQSIIDSLEAKRGDGTNNFWRVYGLGELGIAEGLVFDNFVVEDFDIYGFENYRNGVDWGFSTDPFAFVRSAVEQNRLYICQELFQRNLSNAEAVKLIKPIVRNEEVWCDSAEPKSVAEFQSLGIAAKSVKKGAGSLESGIKHMQAFDQIVVHPSCVNVLDEFRNYQWQQDKNGVWLTVPVDSFNHGMDGIRYSLERDMIYKKPLVKPSQPVYSPRNYGNEGWMG